MITVLIDSWVEKELLERVHAPQHSDSLLTVPQTCPLFSIFKWQLILKGEQCASICRWSWQRSPLAKQANEGLRTRVILNFVTVANRTISCSYAANNKWCLLKQSCILSRAKYSALKQENCWFPILGQNQFSRGPSPDCYVQIGFQECLLGSVPGASL